MSKAYISVPYTNKSVIVKNKAFGEIKDESYKNFLEIIDTTARKCGFKTVLPPRDIFNWGDVDLNSEELAKKDFEEFKSSDILIDYPEESRGANVCIGWASMMKKKIIILLNEKDSDSLSYLILKKMTETRIVRFKDIMDMESKLSSTLREFCPQSS